MTVIADTGALYALVDKDDDWHAQVLRWWEENEEEVLIPASVLPELLYLFATRIGSRAEEAFVRAIVQGEFEIEDLRAVDYARAAEIMARYRDGGLGFVDASVVAIAERLESRIVLTTDRRHFATVRPRHVRAFSLQP